MRVEELHLAAFGPFTDKTLVFDSNAAALHIVYGPNEAGKSSALRGLKTLLYGFETRTLDNFLHANDKLRVSGCIGNTEGHQLTFVRRKGRKNTLLTRAGEVLDEQALSPFLRGVSADLFQTLFGIDHQALVQGGQEILEQKGEVGQALFSAALGSHSLHTVLEQLGNEADALFRPKGSTQTLNAALKSHTELKKAIREQSLSSREWDEHHRALGRTRQALEKVQAELARHRIEVNRLKRFQRVLPKLAQHRELLQALESLADVVILPADFAPRHQQAVKALETAQILAKKATPRLDGLQQQLNELSINQALLDQADNIEDLRTRLGDHRKALQDQPHLQAERQQLLADAEFILKEVRPDFKLTEIESLHPMLARRQSITELGNQNALLVSREKQMDASRRETETRLKAARKEHQALAEIGSADALRRTITAARKLGDLDTLIQSNQSDAVSLKAQCVAGLSRLTLWHGDLQDLLGLEVPDRESIHCFEERYTTLEKRCQRLKEKQQETLDALQDAALRLDEMQRTGLVPTETELVAIRSERDQIWRQLRRQWTDGEAIEVTLADTYEGQLTAADELSDRLRREADRVHTLASLQAKQTAAQQQAAQINQQLEVSTDDRRQLDADWQALWACCQIQPQTPREMRAWLDHLDKLRDQLGQFQLLQQKTEALEQTRTTHIQWLNQQLATAGQAGVKAEALETVLLACEAVTEQFDAIKQKYDGLNKEISDLETQLESLTDNHQVAMQELEVWAHQWQLLTEGFGLQAHASPSEVTYFIDRVRELFSKQNEAEKLQIRIKAIDRDAESYRTLVSHILVNVASELVDLPMDNAVMRLHSLLADNRTRQTQYEQIKAQLEQARQEIEDARLTIQSMTDKLDSLCVEAQCHAHTELDEAESRSAQLMSIKTSIQTLEQAILETGEGASIAALEEETQAIDADALPGRIEALINTIESELEPKRTALASTRGRQEKELELMDGGDQVATLTDQAYALLASIRSDAERYVRVKLAGRVLRDQIEQYRQANQGPLVKRASAYFTALTLGSFAGLITDFNEKDQPVLVGIRPEGARVTVAGMSSGTRDQLYLALRLASLEKYMESAEPMPFIVDDVLLEFDDLRSAAALHALEALSEKTQVIVFTHHSRLVEQARRLSGSVQVHEL